MTKTPTTTTEPVFTFTDKALANLLLAIWGRGYINVLEIQGMFDNQLLANGEELHLELTMRRNTEISNMLECLAKKRMQGIEYFVE